jgi:hypothetical protein
MTITVEYTPAENGNLDLHELADTPGYGRAEVEIKRTGLWDEYAGLPMKKYSVSVEYQVLGTETKSVQVSARCEEEADELACEKVRDMHDSEIDVFDAEVKQCQ